MLFTEADTNYYGTWTSVSSAWFFGSKTSSPPTTADDDVACDSNARAKAPSKLTLDRLQRATGLFAHNPEEVVEAFAVAADHDGLIALSDFLDVITSLRISAAFRVSAEQAPGGDSLALALSEPRTPQDEKAILDLFASFAEAPLGAAVGSEAGEPCADFVELLTSLLVLCGGSPETPYSTPPCASMIQKRQGRSAAQR